MQAFPTPSVYNITRCTLKNEHVAWQTQPMLRRSLHALACGCISDNLGVGENLWNLQIDAVQLCLPHNCPCNVSALVEITRSSGPEAAKRKHDEILTVMKCIEKALYIFVHTKKCLFPPKKSALMSSGDMNNMPTQSPLCAVATCDAPRDSEAQASQFLTLEGVS
jgi:hypothetical protein